MKNIVKEILKKLIFNVKLYRHKKRFFFSQKNTFGLSVKQIKKSNKLGFTADEYAIYDLDNNDPNDYISEFERELFRDAVRDYRVLLDNKIVFYNLIRNFGRVNEIFAYKKNGNYVCISNEFEQKNILKKIKEIGYIVYKEISMGGGVGFRLLSYISGGIA